MGIVKGLAKINKTIEAEEAKFAGKSGGDSDAPRTTFFKIQDKQSVKVAFLQEFDPDAKNYSLKNGLAFVAVEHKNPQNFKSKALCTLDEGPCWACEKHDENWKAGWKQKLQMYANVLVDEGNGKEPYVAVISQGNGDKSITPSLLEFAGAYETVTDRWYKIKRTGAGQQDTSYTIVPLAEHGLDVEGYELFDLETVVRNVPYEEQEEHYFKFTKRDDAEAVHTESARSNNTPVDVNNQW